MSSKPDKSASIPGDLVMTEELAATRELIEVALQMIDQGVGMISEEEINAWLFSDDDDF